VYDQGLLVGLCTQVSVCSSYSLLTSRQTHTQTDSILTSLYEQFSQLS